MSSLPRFAVGTVQPEVDLRAFSWALLRLLKHMDFDVQSFLSRACFPTHDGAHVATGQRTRHLDSWTMSEEVCTELMLQGSEHADVVVVEGVYDCAREQLGGGSLDQLCQWLGLPRIAVIDVGQLTSGRLPNMGSQVDGIFLDGVTNKTELYRAKTNLEAIFQAPVIGSLSRVDGMRNAIDALPDGSKPPVDLCDALARDLADQFWPETLFKISERTNTCLNTSDAFNHFVDLSNRRVAVAYDDAFHCYFPDTLELLERRGATMIDFSPLSCESVPTNVDVVYFGCGPLEQHAAALSNNCCLRQTLKQHVRQGGLVYAECSAIGYLCDEMITDGTSHRMVGLIPAIAHHEQTTTEMTPLRSTFTSDCWLGNRGDELRGYAAHNWRFECQPQVETFSQSQFGEACLMGCGSVLASPMHIDFAAQPERLHRFCRPVRRVMGVS